MSGFSFGGAAPAPAAAPAAPAAGGFSFGRAAPPAPPAPAPAQAVGGFSFGGAAPPAPAPGAPPAAAAPAQAGGGVSLSGGNPPAAAQAPAVGAAADGAAQAPSLTVPPFEEAFPYLSLHARVSGALTSVQSPSFPDRSSGGPSLEAQGLIHILRCVDDAGEGSVGRSLSRPENPAANDIPADPSARSRLQSDPRVLLRGKVAAVTPRMTEEIFGLADGLGISEIRAAALYAGASDVETRRWLEGRLSRSLVDIAAASAATKKDDKRRRGARIPDSEMGGTAIDSPDHDAMSTETGEGAGNGQGRRCDPFSPPRFGGDVVWAARELYFYERSRPLATLLMLVKGRVRASSDLSVGGVATVEARAVLEATDQLLQDGLVTSLIRIVRDLTERAEGVAARMAEEEATRAEAQAAAAAAVPSAYGYGAPPPAAPTPALPPLSRRVQSLDPALLHFALSQRQAASDILFYLSYHTQLLPDEVAGLIDLVRDLTNGAGRGGPGGVGCGLPLLNPVEDDVPRIWKSVIAPRAMDGQQAHQPRPDVAHWPAGGPWVASYQQQQQ